MELRRYERDARSIPVLGDTSGLIKIGAQSAFSITDGNLYLSDPENGSILTAVGSHIQYLVNVDSM